MSFDLSAAQSFMASHARLLDRRRLELLLDGGEPTAVLAALEAYRNPDGGYGWGLEPDLRATESQPGGAYHAFEVFEDIAPTTSPRAAELCDWLASVALPGGGLPFAPTPDRSARGLFSQETIDTDLRRLAGEQQDDGGWLADFNNYSPAAVLEWRGYMTVRAVSILQRN